MRRKENSANEKSKREQMIDAIIGSDTEISEESASEILALYGLSDNDLIDSFKASIARRLREAPVESERARILAGMLRNVRDRQKVLTGEKLTPKERISQLIGGLLRPKMSANYAFRDRKEGELPDADKRILDDLKQELLDGSEQDAE